VRLSRPVLATLLAALVVLGAAGGAAADPLPDGDFSIVYDGKTVSSMAGKASTAATTVTLTCSGGSCRTDSRAVPGSFPLGSGGTYRATKPQRIADGACGGVVAVVTTTVRATERTLRLTTSSPPASKTCSTGGWNVPALSSSFEGTATASPVVGGGTDPAENADEPSRGEAGPLAGGTSGGDDGTTTSRLASGSASAPSVLSALPTASDAVPDGRQALLIAALVVILVLLVAFPTHLLNTAVDAGQESLASWWRRRRGRAEGPDAEAQPVTRWATAAATVLAASLVSAFVDPQFGFNSGSARTFASIAISLTVESVLVWLTVIWLVGRMAPTVTASFRVAPSTLVVVVAAVAITRLTGFEPAIVFGLVAGVAFGAATTVAAEGKTVLAGVGLALVLAVAGWVAYSLLDTGPGAGLATVLASETFAALAIAGIASLPIALVPLRGLAGHALYAWSRPLWAVSYAVGLVGFFVVLMPMPFSWAGVDLSLATWITLYVAYAVAGVTAWAWVVRPWRREMVGAP
jgi:hypothetical protein